MMCDNQDSCTPPENRGRGAAARRGGGAGLGQARSTQSTIQEPPVAEVSTESLMLTPLQQWLLCSCIDLVLAQPPICWAKTGISVLQTPTMYQLHMQSWQGCTMVCGVHFHGDVWKQASAYHRPCVLLNNVCTAHLKRCLLVLCQQSCMAEVTRDRLTSARSLCGVCEDHDICQQLWTRCSRDCLRPSLS